jgi:hypothetical protein
MDGRYSRLPVSDSHRGMYCCDNTNSVANHNRAPATRVQAILGSLHEIDCRSQWIQLSQGIIEWRARDKRGWPRLGCERKPEEFVWDSRVREGATNCRTCFR